jgi:hypothetical protein
MTPDTLLWRAGNAAADGLLGTFHERALLLLVATPEKKR